jgi:hypothetical protein
MQLSNSKRSTGLARSLDPGGIPEHPLQRFLPFDSVVSVGVQCRPKTLLGGRRPIARLASRLIARPLVRQTAYFGERDRLIRRL